MQKTSQTGEDWSDIITPDILSDISLYVTGSRKNDFEWIEDRGINPDGSGPKHNVGQCTVLDFDGVRHYLTLGKPSNDGRNSYFQSIPAAFRRLINDPHPQKIFHFYALPNAEPADEPYEEIRTQYHTYIFRLLLTIGWRVNWSSFRGEEPQPISSFHELIQSRDSLERRNNNSTYGYIEQEEDGNTFHLFAKTYGASKYESFLLALAALNIDQSTRIALHSLEEGQLSELPSWCLDHLQEVGEGRFETDALGIGMDENRPLEPIFPPPLRSYRHRQSLQNWAGPEKCVFCNEDNPNMIHAAHLLEVHVLNRRAIEGDDELNLQLIAQAIDGANGLWACHNHHLDFDHNRLSIRLDGAIVVNPEIGQMAVDCIFESLTTVNLSDILSNPDVGWRISNYLHERHQIALEKGIDIREWIEAPA
jgi:hypothetical protein